MNSEPVNRQFVDLALRILSPRIAVYCDAIAFRIRAALMPRCDDNELIASVGRVEWDLHPEGGYMLTTKKTMQVTDTNGRSYRITVEELP